MSRDCRDCIYYEYYFHKINDPDYDYRCDKYKECFKDRYGSTCYWFEDKEDVRQREIAEKNRRERNFLVGLAAGGFFGKPEEEDPEMSNGRSNCNSSNESKGFPLKSFVVLGSIYGCILVAGICFIGYAFKEFFLYDLPKGASKPAAGIEKQVGEVTVNNPAIGGNVKTADVVVKYEETGATGDDSLISIGTEVALRNNSVIKYYNTYFSGSDGISYRNEHLDGRVTKILDYRVTKYLGGARLKEDLNFPKGVKVSSRYIYNLRKGCRIMVGKRIGDKYECIVPLKNDQELKILLSRAQFRAYDNRNWYLVTLPGKKVVYPVWVDSKQIVTVRRK